MKLLVALSVCALLVPVSALAQAAQPTVVQAVQPTVLTCIAPTTGMRDVLTLNMAQRTADVRIFSRLPNGSTQENIGWHGTITSIADQEIDFHFPRTEEGNSLGPFDFVLNRYTLQFGPASDPGYMACQKQQRQL